MREVLVGMKVYEEDGAETRSALLSLLGLHGVSDGAVGLDV